MVDHPKSFTQPQPELSVSWRILAPHQWVKRRVDLLGIAIEEQDDIGWSRIKRTKPIRWAGGDLKFYKHTYVHIYIYIYI